MEILLAEGIDETDASLVARVAESLRGGGVAVLPTDSVYGICCAATSGNPAHERIFKVKGRERSQTLPWFVADASDLEVYGPRRAPLGGPPCRASLARLRLRSWVRASERVPGEYAQQTPTGGAPSPCASRGPSSTVPLSACSGAPSPRRAPTPTARPRPPRARSLTRTSPRPLTSWSMRGRHPWALRLPSSMQRGRSRACCVRAPSQKPRSSPSRAPSHKARTAISGSRVRGCGHVAARGMGEGPRRVPCYI